MVDNSLANRTMDPLHVLLVCGRALLAGFSDEVDALLQLQPGSVAWAAQVRRLERLGK